jgi:hypothetical protein
MPWSFFLLKMMHPTEIPRQANWTAMMITKKTILTILCLALPLPALTNGDSSSGSLALSVSCNRASFVDSGFSATATITATATRNGSAVTIDPGDITWTVESSSITAPWWGNRSSEAMNGLTWGTTPLSLNTVQAEEASVSGTAPSGNSATLTDIVGLRTVVVKAAMTINSTAYRQTATVSFGPGPLSVFADKPKGSMNWADAATACGGTPGNPSSVGYQASTKLPLVTLLQNVAGSGKGGQYGAAHAAGWPDDGTNDVWFCYWTGEADGGNDARVVCLDYGLAFAVYDVTSDIPVTVCLH